jgi:hypothetical protein
MKTSRGLPLAIALALVAAAPVAGQHGSQMGQQEGPRMTGDGTCMMGTMPTGPTAHMPGMVEENTSAMRADCTCPMMAPSEARGTAGVIQDRELLDARRNRVRRATGPTRMSRATTASVAASPADDVGDAGRELMRRATGPTRLSRVTTASVAASPADESPSVGRNRVRRATGPTRIPRGWPR